MSLATITHPITHTAPTFMLAEDDLNCLLNHASNRVPIDVPALFKQCMGNMSFALALLEEFERTGYERLEEFAVQAANGDLTATADLAHGLIGVAGVLAAKTLRELSAKIESVARAGDAMRTRELVSQLRDEMQRCLDYIPDIRATAQRSHDSLDELGRR
jgi:HPt (histidine-containing phosphotransfer) domain-containing protein